MNQERENFLDPKTIIAIILVGAVWFGWQNYLTKKYPRPKPTEQTAVTAPAATAPTTPEAATPSAPAPVAAIPAKASEQTLKFEDDIWSFEISSLGMGLKGIQLKRYFDRSEKPIIIGSTEKYLPLMTQLKELATPPPFSLQKKSETEFVGVARVGSATITKTLKIDSAKYSIFVRTEVSDQQGQIAGITHILSEDTLHKNSKTAEGKNIATDTSQWQSFFIAHGTTTDRSFSSQDSPYDKGFTQVSLASMSSRYFTQGFFDSSSVLPEFRTGTDATDEKMYGQLTHTKNPELKEMDLQFQFYAGPKDLKLLNSANPQFVKIVDFGFFSWLAEPLLKLMNWFFSITLNYGVAIILLTLLVRFVVLPFNIMSYKSMKAMQTIQPHMQRLREKYKNDPQAMNRETMNLMREHKVNPIGGCLPMFLQLPVFFALYQVLDHSIELYKAPFMFWIHDLSLKDPYYILPVLMGITMYVQQKITPSTLDPAQAKVLQFMPILFSFFMLTLPSGLTLYIFVSTLFGICQQYLFMRDKSLTTQAASAQT
ncbi:MAG: membrane protein insertase YidC [Bdellovibrionales bacterium]